MYRFSFFYEKQVCQWTLHTLIFLQVTEVLPLAHTREAKTRFTFGYSPFSFFLTYSVQMRTLQSMVAFLISLAFVSIFLPFLANPFLSCQILSSFPLFLWLLGSYALQILPLGIAIKMINPLIITFLLIKLLHYINNNEIPSELSRENLISSQVKMTCYLHM